MSTSTREIRLASRPDGEPKETDFALEGSEVADPGVAQLLVRNIWMSVDPYMRPRMNDVPSYVPCFRLGEPLDGGAIGEVIASEVAEFPVGSFVLHGLGWREHALLHRKFARAINPAPGVSLSQYLGVLGIPGLTAYAGLFEVGAFKEGDTVFVSGAAGAVGSLVGQFARLRGAGRVIGSAGSAEKVRHLVDDLGFDAAFDYHHGSVRKQLAAVAPSGIDVYFDNVGGEHLEAAIGALKPHGRVALCGAISTYNESSVPAGPRNLALAIGRRLSLRGFIVTDHEHLRAEFEHAVTGWLSAGSLVVRQTFMDGLENAPAAFIAMLRGANTGKMIVRLSDSPSDS